MSDTEESTASSQAIKAAERIRELNRISEKFPTLLRTASTAISLLTANPKTENSDSPSNQTDSQPSLSLDTRKSLFQSTSQSYLTDLKSLIERLKEEANALVDAGIIPASAPRGGGPGQEEGITNAGMGALDTGMLNARVGDPGKGWEAEVVGRARELVGERVLKENVQKDAKNEGG